MGLFIEEKEGKIRWTTEGRITDITSNEICKGDANAVAFSIALSYDNGESTSKKRICLSEKELDALLYFILNSSLTKKRMRERFGKTITNENPSSNEPKKSVLEGLKMIPYAKIREAALANYDPEYNNGNGNAKDRKVDCITDAILYGFNHEKTPQGDDFWGEINQAFYILQGQGDHADKLQGLPPSVEEN